MSSGDRCRSLLARLTGSGSRACRGTGDSHLGILLRKAYGEQVASTRPPKLPAKAKARSLHFASIRPDAKIGVEIFRGGIMSCMATMTKPVTIAPPPGQQFYPAAYDFFSRLLPTALTYDDVSLATLYSEILPKDADLTTNLSETLRLQIPIISSDMDTVTESRMAIAMSLNGGLGLIHYNVPAKDQVKEVARVKRHIHGLIQDPITVSVKLSVG